MRFRYLGSVADSASGSNETLNLADYIIDGEAANPAGPLKTQHKDGSTRAVMIQIDNTAGAAACYLVPPSEIPGAEILPVTAAVVPPGVSDQFGPVSLPMALVLRLLDGANVVVSVWQAGGGPA